MKTLRSVATALCLASAPFAASAAPIDLAANGYQLEGTSWIYDPADLNLVLSGSSLALFATDTATGGLEASVTSGNASDASLYSFSFGLGGDTVTGANASVLGGETNVVELLFEGVSGLGSYAFLNGGALLATLSFVPTSVTVSGMSGVGTISFAQLEAYTPVAIVPLPAGGLLLISGLGAAALMRRRKSRG